MFTERFTAELSDSVATPLSILSFSAFWLLLLEEKAVQPGAQKSELKNCFWPFLTIKARRMAAPAAQGRGYRHPQLCKSSTFGYFCTTRLEERQCSQAHKKSELRFFPPRLAFPNNTGDARFTAFGFMYGGFGVRGGPPI